MSIQIENKIREIREKIRKHDHSYYVLSQPLVSDKEYDELMSELKKLEERYPQFLTDDSPTRRLSSGVSPGFTTVRHRQGMFSLDNTYSIDELSGWDERVRKGLGAGIYEYVVELKIDGVSANLTYRGGRLVLGATRGDGYSGEDVTANIRTIRAIPLSLAGRRLPKTVEIRGEVYMNKPDFSALNKERMGKSEALFANPRNAASGSLKLLDSGIVARRHLNFFAHSLGACSDSSIRTQWDFFSALKEWGMRVDVHSRLCGDINEVIEFCRRWQQRRDELDYEIDGVVVKVNSFNQQKELGFTSKSPRWAVAYKFAARQATTEITAIRLNVGRTGVVTPTAQLKPVECSGVIISSATLHNFDEIERLGLREGDRVLIERAGDVIPKVVKVVEQIGKESYKLPLKCPVCGEKIVKEKEEDVAYRCINPACPAQLERALEHFAGRDAMDIEGMGEVVIAQLTGLKLLKSPADVYKLKSADLLKLELFKEKKAGKLLEAIGKSKQRSLERLIFALGIRHVGQKAAYTLAEKFGDMRKFMLASFDDLDSLPEVGRVMASSIVDYFKLRQTERLIRELEGSGVNMRFQPASRMSGSRLAGKSVVFTGELSGFSRSEAQDLVRRSGGFVSSSVSGKTDFLVSANKSGSKLRKARQLGVKIIDESEFKEMIG